MDSEQKRPAAAIGDYPIRPAGQQREGPQLMMTGDWDDKTRGPVGTAPAPPKRTGGARNLGQRLTTLILGSGVIMATLVITVPRYETATGRLLPPPADGQPVYIEVTDPKLWLDVETWTDEDGRFMLWLLEENTAITLQIERPGCGPYTASGMLFTAKLDTPIHVPPCPRGDEDAR